MLHLGCWTCLEKLAEMFLNTFHRRSFLINEAVKSYRKKLVLKHYSWSLVLLMLFSGMVMTEVGFFVL